MDVPVKTKATLAPGKKKCIGAKKVLAMVQGVEYNLDIESDGGYQPPPKLPVKVDRRDGLAGSSRSKADARMPSTIARLSNVECLPSVVSGYNAIVALRNWQFPANYIAGRSG